MPLRVTRSWLTDPEESGLPPGADRLPASFPVLASVCLALPAPRGSLVSVGAHGRTGSVCPASVWSEAGPTAPEG